eukprot:2796710-Rhodomonas_salina.2
MDTREDTVQAIGHQNTRAGVDSDAREENAWQHARDKNLQNAMELVSAKNCSKSSSGAARNVAGMLYEWKLAAGQHVWCWRRQAMYGRRRVVPLLAAEARGVLDDVPS